MHISEAITSPANPRVKRVAQLRDAASRRKTGLTLVDGLRELSRAAAAGIEGADLSKIDLPAGVADIVAGEGEAVPVVAKKPAVRKKIAAPKSE